MSSVDVDNVCVKRLYGRFSHADMSFYSGDMSAKTSVGDRMPNTIRMLFLLRQSSIVEVLIVVLSSFCCIILVPFRTTTSAPSPATMRLSRSPIITLARRWSNESKVDVDDLV